MERAGKSALSRALVAALLISAAPPGLAWDQEVNSLLQWLDKYGYGDFAKAVRKTHLPSVMAKLLEKGHRLTILAPTNGAMQGYKGPQCCIPLDTVLSLHILDGTYSAKKLISAKNGALYPTGTAVPVAKKESSPLRLGVETGFLQWQSVASVVWADAYYTRYFTVHGINSVLQYPCYSRFY